jgi:16S rRNA (uracil1498-N3)-methyltransferase
VSVPRLYVPDLDPSSARVALPEGEAHHVARVLRLRAGDAVRVFDGRGREWAARLAASERRSATTVELVAEVAPIPEPSLRVTLAAGILKGDHMDAVVRDAVMMGATEIVPLVTEHVTVPKKAWQGSAVLERWRRVAVASAKQCGRAVVPEIATPAEFAVVLSGHAGQSIVMFVEPAVGEDAKSIAGTPMAPGGTLLVLIGPEGGWSSAEVTQGRAAGAMLAHLGPRTIRADAMATAALAALGTVLNR